MANETIGDLMHHCGHRSDVRKDKNGRLYLNCPSCGQLKYNLPDGQDYILSNANMYGAGGRRDAVARNVTNVTEHNVTNVTEHNKVGGSFLDDLPQDAG